MKDEDFPDGVTAEAVRELRLSMGMNQTDFGRLLGVVKRTVSNWERGQAIPAMSEHRIRELAATRRMHEAVDVPPSLADEVAELRDRVDYLEAIVLRERADELAARRAGRGCRRLPLRCEVSPTVTWTSTLRARPTRRTRDSSR